MTVEEYSAAVEARLTLELVEPWVESDLRLNLKFVKRRGEVLPTDVYLLEKLGKPWWGYVVRWATTKQLSKKKLVQRQQAQLF